MNKEVISNAGQMELGQIQTAIRLKSLLYYVCGRGWKCGGYSRGEEHASILWVAPGSSRSRIQYRQDRWRIYNDFHYSIMSHSLLEGDMHQLFWWLAAAKRGYAANRAAGGYVIMSTMVWCGTLVEMNMRQFFQWLVVAHGHGHGSGMRGRQGPIHDSSGKTGPVSWHLAFLWEFDGILHCIQHVADIFN